MLHSLPSNPIQLLGVAAKRDEPKPQLPSKRTRDAICGLGTSNKPFAIKPYPGSPYDRPATFKPVRVIGRSQLPLTLLDTTPDENFAANSLFAAHIDILEAGHESGKESGDAPRILIARYEAKRNLYAIERVQPQVYSTCRLASWLKEKDMSDLWDPSNMQLYPASRQPCQSSLGKGEWWQHAAVEASHAGPPVKRARMTMMRPVHAPEPTKAKALQRFDSPATYEPIAADTIPVLEEQMPLPSPHEQLELLVQQYLDAVYISKTSLAYFTKGPMARIRNAFTSPEEGAPPTHELVTYLRSMLLTPKASEKKYYEKLPAIIKALPRGSYSDEELATGAGKPKKTKKKTKLSREGVYPHEEDFIKKWWTSDMASGHVGSEETLDQRIRRRIGELRVRETLAQLALMLEVIALEALGHYKPPADETFPGDETQLQEDAQAKAKKRKKKLDDIGLQLDLLLDRLCIWHATEEAGILDFDSKVARHHDGAEGPGKGGASDRLRDFCIEVIIPFYMNRLPEQALMINRKLGGPAHTSPPKRKAMKPPTTTRKSGEAKEAEVKKSRRWLARIATESLGSRSRDGIPPSLSRCATDSALISGIKREGSEAALSTIPFQRSPSRDNRRSMSHFRHLEGRELDLTTPSAAVTAKLKQKQRVEEELKDAIAALKKPNRGLAAGGYAEEVERRSIGSSSRWRKQSNGTRKVVKDVQVTATPKVGRRTRDVVEQTPSQQHMSNPFARVSTSAGAGASASDLFIPSSGARQQAMVPGTERRSATGRPVLGQQDVAETPCKAGKTKDLDSGAARRRMFATPTKPTRAGADRVACPGFESGVKGVGSSCRAARDVAPVAAGGTGMQPFRVAAAVSLMAAAGQDEERSMYASLGWDDDEDA
ncbi:hypothetical protein ACEQ8H_003770 [Pleosporales sp. CAS-2024a]